MMIKPKALKKGDTIGIIAPSGPVRVAEYVDKAVQKVLDMGFNVKEGKSIREAYGFLAGKDNARIKDIHEMFADSKVDGIFCLKGGYGTPRITSDIDINIIKNNPKLFIGYSDITSLHILFNQQANLITFHGPMPASDMIFEYGTFSHNSFIKAITSTNPLGELKNPEGYEINCLVGGKITAPVVGGNLTLVATSIGSSYEIDTKGKILFIEDTGEEAYQIDRYLCQLKNAGKFKDLKGVIIGDWNEPEEYKTEPTLTIDEVISDLLVPLNIPIVSNFRAGHCEPKITIPLGAVVTVDADNKKIIVEESCLS